MTVHAFRGTIVDFPPSTVPCALRVRTDAIVVVRSGRVADILESGADERTEDARIQALAEEGALVHVLDPNQFLLPGLVDLHIHAPQSTYAGTATDRPLMGADGWLETYTFPAERRMADPSLARQVYDRVVERGLRHGTTTAVYFATIHLEATKALAETCRRRGQRGYVEEEVACCYWWRYARLLLSRRYCYYYYYYYYYYSGVLLLLLLRSPRYYYYYYLTHSPHLSGTSARSAWTATRRRTTARRRRRRSPGRVPSASGSPLRSRPTSTACRRWCGR